MVSFPDQVYERVSMKNAHAVNASDGHVSGVRAVQRVLVVDDDLDGAEMVAEMLDALGFEAKFALDGPSAIELAKMFAPHLMLLDISLAEMDGYEVARRVRLDPALSDIVLVAVTGWIGAEHELKAREAGFDHYLVKPIQMSALKPVLEA